MEPYENIRKWRAIRNYKQQFMAARLGMTQQAYALIENGTTRLRPPLDQKIADILEIPLAEIYRDTVDAPLTESERALYEKLLAEKDKVISAQDIIIKEWI